MDRVRGFTITELMVGVAIAGVLALAATPDFQRMLQRHAIKTAQEDLYADLSFARAEAISRARPLTLCAVADADADTPVCSNTPSAWQRGWILFTDTDRDGEVDPPADHIPGDEYLRLHALPGAGRGFSLQFNGLQNRITFTGRGLLHSGHGTFVFCAPEISFAEALILSPGTGRVRYSRAAANGGALPCPG